MKLNEALKDEYIKLRKKSREANDIVYSEAPAIRNLGEMRVDPEGVCNIGIKDRDAFDFDGILEHIRDTSVTPEPGLVVKALRKMLKKQALELEKDLHGFYNGAWSIQDGEKESYAVRFPGNRLRRVSLKEIETPEGREEEITYWNVLLGFLGETNIANVHRYTGLDRELHSKDYGIYLWKPRYATDFIDLFFKGCPSGTQFQATSLTALPQS